MAIHNAFGIPDPPPRNVPQIDLDVLQPIINLRKGIDQIVKDNPTLTAPKLWEKLANSYTELKMKERNAMLELGSLKHWFKGDSMIKAFKQKVLAMLPSAAKSATYSEIHLTMKSWRTPLF